MMAKKRGCLTRKAKFYVILLKFDRVKFCLGKLTRVFKFCLGNPNSVPVLPRLPTLLSNPVNTIDILLPIFFSNRLKLPHSGCLPTLKSKINILKSLFQLQWYMPGYFE